MNVRGLMGETGITQAEVGRWLGLSQAAIAKRVSTRSVVFNVDELEAIANNFGVPVQSLFDPPRVAVASPFRSGGVKEAGRPEGRPADVAGAGFEPATSGLCRADSITSELLADLVAAAEAHANSQAVMS
jgi:transcriptional regulator with XRE-family HTH domain